MKNQMTNGAASPAERAPFVVSRDEIRAIHSVEQDGVRHQLGELRDFRWQDQLATFIPPDDQMSVSWVSLAAGETLPAHVHPIQSMMIFHAGSGRVFGDLERDIAAGDVVVVPPGREHGFVAGPSGLSALSIQFGQGLYTDPERARVVFSDGDSDSGSHGDRGQAALDALHRRRLEAFQQSELFRMLADGSLAASHRRRIFLDAARVWGRSARALSAHADGGAASGVAARDTEHADPAIEAILSWFFHRMVLLDHAERLVVVRFVVSPAWNTVADSVGRSLAPFGDPLGSDGALPNVPAVVPPCAPTPARLEALVDEAWDMIDALAQRIAERTLAA